MQIKLDKHKRKSGIKTQIRIVEAFRPAPGAAPKQRTIESLGYLEDKENPEEFMEKLRKSVAARNQEKSVTINLDFSAKNKDKSNLSRNYGALFIEKIYNLLQLPQFFADQRIYKADYDLNAIFFFLTVMRILDPDSKRATFMGAETLYGRSFDFDLPDIYRALDKIDALKSKLEEHLNKRIGALCQREPSCLYLDATNYYFQTDFAREGSLPQKGVSKEHRLEPIVQMGLILDSNGLPILSEAFPGNTSDCSMLIPMVKRAIACNPKERYVVVADKGLNSSANIDYLVNREFGYVFSQTLRGTKGKRYEEHLFSDDNYIVNSDGSYKYKVVTETYFGIDASGKKIERQRKALLYWDLKDAELARKKRGVKVKRSQKALKNRAYMIDHSSLEYVKESVCDPDSGEILEQAQKSYSLDTSKIAAEEKYDGYFCIITSEMDYDAQKIRETYSHLWKIEQSFRITKSDLDSRPVYVQLDARIRAHFFICHVALLIVRLFELALGGRGISAERIQTVLRRCTLSEPSLGILHLHEIGGKRQFASYVNDSGVLTYSMKTTGQDEIFADYQLLQAAFGITLDAAYIRQEQFNQIIKNSHVALP